jgi:2-iminobutanoate/2-iminopropanoate deaminase
MAESKRRKAKAPQRQAARSSARASANGGLMHCNTPKPRPLPFSDAVRVGNLLYVSGQIGTDENLKLALGGVLPETHRALENIRAILERNGSSLDRVIKCTVMLADMNEWDAMNTVYLTFFSKDKLPARSAFAGTGLAFGARVEIECIAAVK